MKPSTLVILIAVILLAQVAIAAVKGKRRRALQSGPFTYRARGTLLTAAERRFAEALYAAVGHESDVYSKVRLADVIEPVRSTRQSGQDYYRAFNRIAAKHLDFVLCEPGSTRILCAIELDDISHARPDRRERDAFVNAALASAGVPLVRFPAASAYTLADLRHRITSSRDLAPALREPRSVTDPCTK